MEASGTEGGWCRDAVGVDVRTVEASVAGAEVWTQVNGEGEDGRGVYVCMMQSII
jgi:hypothetical protein